jgi:hypothetical protein
VEVAVHGVICCDGVLRNGGAARCPATDGDVEALLKCTNDSRCDQRYPFVVVYNDAKWNLEKRFSDFAELDAQLDEAFKNNEDVVVRGACLTRVDS